MRRTIQLMMTTKTKAPTKAGGVASASSSAASFETPSPSSSSVFRSIAHQRRTCRRFQRDRIIPSEIMKDILQTSLRSPSSFNLQPSQIVLVQSQEVKDTLSQEAMLGIGNQYRVSDASAVAVFLSDLEPTKRIDRIYELESNHQSRNVHYRATMPLSTSFLIGEGHLASWMKQTAASFLSQVQPMPSIEEVQCWSYKNTSLLAMTYLYAAESYNLQTAMMEGFDARRTKEILDIPDRYAVPLMIVTGYEYEEESQRDDDVDNRTVRLDVSEIVFNDSFGQPWKE
mmetsp:Transcript_39263/g.94931  ORF Transcript_39263/g.94931 Transcript_39263/m.94931 type:complete len:285 (-) Transcript_39263:39-893(-)